MSLNDVRVYENRAFVSLYSSNIDMRKNYEFTYAESKAKINGVYKYINFRPGHLATAGPGSAFHTWFTLIAAFQSLGSFPHNQCQH